MLKIQRLTNGMVVFTLSGRIEAECLNEFRQLLAQEQAGNPFAMDLKDVTIVNEAR